MNTLQTSFRQIAYVAAGVAAIMIVLLMAQGSPDAQAAGTFVKQASVTQETSSHAITLNYQAYLVDPSTGQPKADGTYQISFRLYNTDTGGTPLWSDTKDVPVTNGLLNVLLGETVPFDPNDFNSQELWFAVKVGADEEATPRQRIAHVGYAIFAEHADIANSAENATNADKLQGKAALDFAAASHTHTGADIVDGSLDAADIKDGSIGTADLANGAVTAAKLASGVIPKFIDLNVYSAYMDGAGNFQDGFAIAGIHLPDGASTSAFAFNLTLPPNYETGTTLTIRLLWRTSATNCGLTLLPNFLAVTRPGVVNIHGGGSVSRGLDSVGSTTLSAGAAANITSLKEYTIASPDPAVKLAPGDTISFGLFRSPSAAADTCAADLIILGASVTY